MLKRVLLVGFLGIGMVALGWSEASARICVLKSATGACLVYSGSIECGISATGVGNAVNEDVYLACTATGTDLWRVVCGNPGSKEWTSPGINLVYFSGTVYGEYLLQNYDVDRNGRAYGYAVASPSDSLLFAITEAGACPNSNWSALDALPCTMQVRDMQLDANHCVTADAYYDCFLPDCETLGWDINTQMFERRQYECTQTATNSYKSPQYPEGGDCP